MDDRFLHDLRRAPAPGFARQLRTSLKERDSGFAAALAGPAAMRWLSAAASVAVVSFAFSFPSVRAGAQSFLDLFRVVNFAAVSFDAARLEQLSFEGLDIAALLGEQPDNDPAQPMPVSYADLDEASDAAGFEILEPAYVPVGWNRSGLEVTDAHAFSIIARTALLEAVLDQLAIDDLTVPAALDGATVSVRMPPVAHTTFSTNGSEVHLLQSSNPEMLLPGDIEPAQIAEIGLRILGLDRDEAYRLAWTIDWRSTLLLPIPSAQARFEDVSIGASKGLMIIPTNDESEGGTMLLWGNDQQVFAMGGKLPAPQLLEMARTTQ